MCTHVILFLFCRSIQIDTLKEKEFMENAVKIAVEAISSIRTVASLCQESQIVKRYQIEIEKSEKMCFNKYRFRGIVYSLGYIVPMICFGLSYWYGGYLIANGELKYQDVVK